MRSRRSYIYLLCTCLLAISLCFLTGCNSTAPKSTSDGSLPQREGTSFTLGNLSLTVYNQEIVHDIKDRDCLAIYLRVVNKGTETESVMGSYNISRNQGDNVPLKVAVAYDTNGNQLHTGNNRIKPGESADVALCFLLVNTKPVTVTFGNKERGVNETVMSFPVLAGNS